MKMSISQRLYLISCMLVLALLGVSIVAWTSLGDVAKKADTIRAVRTQQLQRIASVELNVTRVSLQLRHAMLSANNPPAVAEALSDIAAKRKLIGETATAYERDSASQADRDFLDRATRTSGAFWELGEANIQLIQAGIQSGGQEEAFAFLVDKTIPARFERCCLR